MEETDTLTTLFTHHLWANLRLLEQCAELTPEQLEATVAGTFGSIHATLQHIVRAEQSYFSRISTGHMYPRPENGLPMTIAEMVAAVRTTGIGLIEGASKVDAGDTVQINWDDTPREVPKTIILTQVINHATEHRAQVMAIMTQLGIQPLALDSWSFFDEA